ncbi:hypothetical protein [Phytoactinopolyspora halotolerans]|uniref:Uncharacterized protein n=1 Tax=Phytoactinopolyspora halotolerans TaxID=1981512 RepID=A0A6L9S4C3_9ACTN|nr:hypothetical protein [Phytoactinopolyspora halotolerans]NED99483.1 hypothetical protein [Phytoactinopolyspora halotolerans]
MTIVKRFTAVAGAAALALPLVACGGDDGDYCDLISGVRDDYSGTDAPEGDDMQEALDRFQEIADAAPSDVQEDWQTLVDGMEAFADPEGMAEMDQDELTELSEQMDPATESVETHVLEECDIDLQEDA